MGGQALTLGLAWLAAVNSRAPLLAIGPVLPMVMQDLGLSFTIAGVLSGLPLLLMGLSGLPGGWLTDRLGARQVMIWCLAGVALAGALRGLAPNEAVLLGGTLLLGLAIGTLQPALPRVARDTMPRRTALATAIYFNGLVIGGAAGLGLTPLLLQVVSWRAVLVGWAIIGGLAVGGWLLVPARQPHALLPGRLRLADIQAALQLPGMVALTVAMGTQSAIFYTVSSWLPTYLVGRGWSLAEASVPIATLPITSIVAGFLTAPAEAHFGRRAVIGLAGAFISAALVIFLIWPDQTAWLCAVAAGGGTTFAFSVALAAPAALAPAHRVGITAGVLLALGYIEATIGPIALGALRDAFGSYVAGWLMVLLMALLLTATTLGIPGREAYRQHALAQDAR